MKQLLAIILTIISVFSVLSINGLAEENNPVTSETTEYLENGNYIVTTLIVEDKNTVSRGTSTKTASRTSTIYSSSDEAMVTVKLTATFTYNGTSATCTNASTSYTIYKSNFGVTESTAYKSANKAFGDFTVKKYILGVPIQSDSFTITITCSNTGVLS